MATPLSTFGERKLLMLEPEPEPEPYGLLYIYEGKKLGSDNSSAAVTIHERDTKYLRIPFDHPRIRKVFTEL